MKTLIANARIVSPDIDLSGASVLMENDRISAVIGAGEPVPPADLTIHAGVFRHPLPRSGPQ
jgi:hypothetical protein